MTEQAKPQITAAGIGKIVLGIVAFFVVVPQIFGLFDRLNPPDFVIPVPEGLPRDELRYWDAHTDRLMADLTAFWLERFSESGLDFAAPILVAPFEGEVPACGSDIASEDWLYCVDTGTLEIRRIVFNAMSRQSVNGEHEQEIAYSFAHLYAHHVQAALGVPLLTGDAQERLEIELQADCLAGFWLGRGAGAYGEVNRSALRDDIGRGPVAPRFNRPGVPRALVENLLLGEPAARFAAVDRGLGAETFGECGLPESR